MKLMAFYLRVILPLAVTLCYALPTFSSDKNFSFLEADVSIIEQLPVPKDQVVPGEKNVVEKEKKFHITWESLGLTSVKESLKKIHPKAWLSAISLKYLYRHLMNLALAEHDRFVGDPYSLGEGAATKLARAQTSLMRDYVTLLSDPEIMQKIIDAETGSEISQNARFEQFVKGNMANLLTPEEAVDFFIYEMSKQPFFPKDPKEYEQFKKLALKWGGIPIGLIVLGNRLSRENLGGQVYLPVFMLPSGYLGLAFTARVDHIGISLSPRLVGQGELVLMRFRLKGTIEEKRGKMFSEDQRNYEVELSEDWSNLFLKKFGLTSHFYYRNRFLNNLKQDTKDHVQEVGYAVATATPGLPNHLFGIIPYTNFNARVQFDSKKNLTGAFVLANQRPNYLWSLSVTGAFNFDTREGSLNTQALYQRPINLYGTSLNAGMSYIVATTGQSGNAFVGITDESHNLSGRLQLTLQDNRGTPVKWQVGVGVAGQLESQRRLEAKYLTNLDAQMRRNITDYKRYQENLLRNVEEIVQSEELWDAVFDSESGGSEVSPKNIEEHFDKSFGTLVVPLHYSIIQVGERLEKQYKDFQNALKDYERKYGQKLATGDCQSPEVVEEINQVISHYNGIKAKSDQDLKNSIFFMALAEHFKAD